MPCARASVTFAVLAKLEVVTLAEAGKLATLNGGCPTVVAPERT